MLSMRSPQDRLLCRRNKPRWGEAPTSTSGRAGCFCSVCATIATSNRSRRRSTRRCALRALVRGHLLRVDPATQEGQAGLCKGWGQLLVCCPADATTYHSHVGDDTEQMPHGSAGAQGGRAMAADLQMPCCDAVYWRGATDEGWQDQAGTDGSMPATERQSPLIVLCMLQSVR